MALGIARTAQLAGWSDTGGNLSGVATLSVSSTLDTTNNLFVNPSYYADFSPVLTASNYSMGIIPSGANVSFNMSGTGTNEWKGVQSLTFRVGTNWMDSAPSGYASAFQLTNYYDNNGTSHFRVVNSYQDSQDGEDGYRFGSDGGGAFISKTAFAGYRNQWLTLLVASSDTSADFADWQGGSDPYGYSWAFRNILFDVSTATAIASLDGWGYNDPAGIDLTQAWTLGFGTSSYTVDSSMYWGSAPTYAENEIQVIAYQEIIGDMVDIGDPAYYNDLLGTGFSTSVGGYTPMLGYTFDSAGTPYAGTYGTIGYEESIPTWSRLPPAKVRIDSQYDLNPPEPPVFTSL